MDNTGLNSENVHVSVVMPAYNAEKTIAESIESVLNQTYVNYELIIVDDASTDSTLHIAVDYGKINSKIRVLRNIKNFGVAVTRNHGIEEARGKYIALLDSDDVWEADKLERQINLAIKERADIVYCSYDFINERGNPIKRPFIVPICTDFEAMLTKSVISCSTVLIDAQLLKRNPFESSIYHEDYTLWMRLFSMPIKAVGDRKVLMHYRQISGSRNEKKLHAAIERWKIYREYLHLSRRKSMMSFFLYAVNGLKKYGC